MILTESFSLDWINQVCKSTQYKDKALMEKAIHALALLEVLVGSGCPLIFKGGSSLLLILKDSLHRLSIDIDVICPPGTDIERYLQKADNLGFTRIVPINVEYPDKAISVSHSKAFFEVAYNAREEKDEGYIRLDVLYEDNPYSKLVQAPIEHKILKTEGNPLIVSVPTKEALLGDKLTAFGPNTIGIPYHKGGRNCSLEIIKQVFDIGRLFDGVTNFTDTFESFNKVADIELSYRNMAGRITEYYEDVRHTAMCIAGRGTFGIGDFTEIRNGLERIKPYMYQNRYYIESAIIDASKAAYLATCFEKGITSIDKYNGIGSITADMKISALLLAKLSRLRASSPEAYFYWHKIGEMLERQ